MNGGSDVNVRFGGDTRGLDDATRRAKADIASLRPAVSGLGGTMEGLERQVKSAFSGGVYEKGATGVANSSKLAAHHAQNLYFQLNDVAMGLGSGQKPMTVFMQQGLQIHQIMQQAGMGVRGFGRSVAEMLGLIKTTRDAELVQEAASAAAAATAVRGAAERAASNVMAADTEVALALAAVRTATSTEALTAAQARLALAHQRVAVAAAEAATAESALALAQGRATATAAAEAATAVTRLTGRVVALGAVAAVAIGAIGYKSVMSFGEGMAKTADEMGRLSSRANMTASEFGGWAYLAKRAEIDTKSLTSAMSRLGKAQVSAANGNRKQVGVFNELGLSIGKAQNNSEMLLQVADRFAEMEDGPKKTALAVALLGKTGEDLIPILNEGSKALEEQIARAKEYGVVLSDELVAAGQRVDDALDDSNMAMTGLSNTMFGALAPAIQVTTEFWADLVKEMTESYRAGGLVRTITDVIVVGFKGIVTVIMVVVEAFKQLYHAAMSSLTPIVGTLSAVMEGVGNAITGNWSEGLTRFRDHMSNVASNTVGHIRKMKDSAVDLGKTLDKLWTEEGLGTPRSRPTGEGGDLGIEGMGPKAKKPKSNDDALRAAIEELEFRKDMARDDFAEQMRLQEMKLALIRQAKGEESQEYKRALREKLRMQRDHDQEVVRMERDRLQLQQELGETAAETDRKLAEERLATRRQQIEFEASLGRMSEQEKLAALARVTEEEYQLEADSLRRIHDAKVAELRSELALQNLRPQDRQRVLDEIDVVEAQHRQEMLVLGASHNQQMVKQAQDAAKAYIDHWKGIVQPITDAFGNVFTQLYNRQIGFRQALLQVADSIVLHWAQKGIQFLGNWVATQLGLKAASAATGAAEVATHTATEASKTGITAAAVATRTTMETSSIVAATAAGIASRVAQVTGLSGVAAAAAFASTAAIPIVGPGLAPAAAAAAMASVLGFIPIASAAGGWGRVPYDGAMAELHKDEMVLPAKFANPLRKSLQGGWDARPTGVAAGVASEAGASTRGTMIDSSRKSGDTNFNYQPSHTNMGASMETLLREDGRSLRKWLKNEMRNGGLSLR